MLLSNLQKQKPRLAFFSAKSKKTFITNSPMATRGISRLLARKKKLPINTRAKQGCLINGRYKKKSQPFNWLVSFLSANFSAAMLVMLVKCSIASVVFCQPRLISTAKVKKNGILNHPIQVPLSFTPSIIQHIVACIVVIQFIWNLNCQMPIQGI